MSVTRSLVVSNLSNFEITDFYTQNFTVSKEPIKIRLLGTFLLHNPDDLLNTNLIVCTLIILELVQTATSTHQAWWYGVTNWNNPSALLEFPWSAMTLPTMSGISEFVNHTNYGLA